MVKVGRYAAGLLVCLMMILGPALVMAGPVNDDPTVQSLLRQAVAQYKLENYEEAVPILLKAHKIAPDNTSVAYFLGLSYKQIPDIAKAIYFFRQSVTGRPRIKEGLPELINALCIAKGKGTKLLDEASKWLALAERDGLMPAADIAFMKGRILAKKNMTAEAIGQYKRAMRLNPKLRQSANFQIAMQYVRSRDLKKARDMFKAAITLDPLSDMASFARQYESALEQRLEMMKPLHITFSAFYQYNDNMLNDAVDHRRYSPTITDDRSLNLTPTVRFDYSPNTTKPWLFNAAYTASANINQKHSNTNDTIANDITITPGYSWGRSSLNLSLEYTHIMKKNPGMAAYLGTLKMGPMFRRVLNKTQILEVYGGYFKNDYADAFLSPDGDRNSRGYNAYISWVWLYMKQGFFNMRLDYSNENTKGDWFDNSSWRVSGNISYPLTAKVKLQASTIFTRTRYDHPSLELDFITITTAARKRHDNLLRSSFGISWACAKRTSLIGQFTRVDSDSNIGQYSYRQNMVSLGLEYRY
ncbi:MAG: tetratricopeptide repeat protein [Deltaproteobacteria bacterium]|nr:tetratricopeptide repeat protein [Deltaproteobacteria bacterium]